MKLGWIVAIAAACDAGTPPPAPTKPAPPPVAPVAPIPPVPLESPRAIPLSEESRTPIDRVFAHPDAAPGKRTRYPTAVILIAPARSAWNADDPSSERPRFVPLVCAIDGALATGQKCGEAMPARATIRTADGMVGVARSQKPFHDTAGEHEYAAPYGPACCMYNTCVETTIPYTAVDAKRESGARTKIGVWPADADVALEVAGSGAAGSAASQALAHIHTWGNGAVALATSDLDHDGTREVIAYELWANDYGIDVFANPAADASYSFNCGNI